MSTNQIRVEYNLAIERPGAVQLDIMPTIQQQPLMEEIQMNELGQLSRPVIEPTRVLRELAFRMVVAPGEFVVVGPSAHIWDGHLAGSLLLCVAILVQLFMRADALYPAIFVVGCSRIALAFWQMFRPLSFITERTQPGLVFNIVAWGSTLIVLIWMRGR
jgi:hypothetical protein